jgi:hypothetical protein
MHKSICGFCVIFYNWPCPQPTSVTWVYILILLIFGWDINTLYPYHNCFGDILMVTIMDVKIDICTFGDRCYGYGCSRL